VRVAEKGGGHRLRHRGERIAGIGSSRKGIGGQGDLLLCTGGVRGEGEGT